MAGQRQNLSLCVILILFWVTVESCVTVNTTESSVGFRAFLFHLLMLRDKQQQVCGSAGQLRICAAEREE